MLAIAWLNKIDSSGEKEVEKKAMQVNVKAAFEIFAIFAFFSISTPRLSM